MSHYLHVCVGDYQLVIRTEGIVALADGEEHQSRGAGVRFHWQGVALPVTALFETLSRAQTARRTMLIFGSSMEDKNAFAMAVDNVIGNREIDDQLFKPVPTFNESFSRLFDGACLDPDQSDGTCLLRLRDPVMTLAPEKENVA